MRLAEVYGIQQTSLLFNETFAWNWLTFHVLLWVHHFQKKIIRIRGQGLGFS